MKLFSKKLLSLILAATLTISSSVPAFAKDRDADEAPITVTSKETKQLDKKKIEKPAKVAPIIIYGVAIVIEAGVTTGLVFHKLNKIVYKFEKIKEGEIEDAIKDHFDLWVYSSSRNLKTWKVGTGKTVILECGDVYDYGLEHILAKHVPKYFYETYDTRDSSKITFFQPETTVGDVVKELDYVVNKYKSAISQKGFKNGEEAFTVKGSDGKDYILVIKSGKIITFYPDKWNRATIWTTWQGGTQT